MEAGPEMRVRAPQQQRSRESWERVLNAGVAILEDGGTTAFTIAAVCERAQVVPRAIYARVEDKDALFLAVYEHGMARIRRDHEVFADTKRWTGLTIDATVTRAVREVAAIFARHSRLLRAVVLIAGVHPEVTRRGAFHAQDLADRFTARLLSAGVADEQPDPEAAVRMAFEVLFSALVIRTAYGQAFLGAPVGPQEFVARLDRMIRACLLPDA
jgi:AcrR family transcriptional regulator